MLKITYNKIDRAMLDTWLSDHEIELYIWDCVDTNGIEYYSAQVDMDMLRIVCSSYSIMRLLKDLAKKITLAYNTYNDDQINLTVNSGVKKRVLGVMQNG